MKVLVLNRFLKPDTNYDVCQEWFCEICIHLRMALQLFAYYANEFCLL